MANKHRPGRKKRPSKVNYNAAKRWITNRLKRINRHLKKHPNDKKAESCLVT